MNEYPEPQVSAGPPPAAAKPTEVESPHPLTALVKGWIALVATALFIGRDLLENPGDFKLKDIGWAGWVIGAILLLQIVWGFFEWRTTRFVVDDHELRIEHNFIQHTSDRVPFTKIQSVDVVQPFAARLLGLAAIHVDAGAGPAKKIEFLTRARCYAMRDYLMERAHGRQTTVEESARTPQAGVYQDVAAGDQVLVRAEPRNIVLAALLSTEMMIWGLMTLGTVIVSIATREFVGLAVLLPAVSGIGGLISNRLIKQWNYSLVRSGTRGLRISRGLTSLASQSVPVDRIQALTVRQAPLWRPFGIYRATMVTLGVGISDGEVGDKTLLPAGTLDDVQRAVDALWPGTRLEQLPWQGLDARARRLCWLGWRNQAYAITEELFAVRGGWLGRKIEMVPHARVQSIGVHQGPLDRWAGLATVAADTTLAPVNRKWLTSELAGRLALDELDRGREARRRDLERRRLMAFAPPPAPAAPTTPVAPGRGGPQTVAPSVAPNNRGWAPPQTGPGGVPSGPDFAPPAPGTGELPPPV